MAHSYQIAQSIQQFFDSNDLKYMYLEDKHVFVTSLPVQDSLVEQYRLILRMGEDEVISHAQIETNVEEAHRKEVSHFLTRVNYGLKNGGFDMDFGDGEIRYRVFIDSGDRELTGQELFNLIILPGMMFSKFGNSLLAVMYGVADAEAAYGECMKES